MDEVSEEDMVVIGEKPKPLITVDSEKKEKSKLAKARTMQVQTTSSYIDIQTPCPLFFFLTGIILEILS